MHTCTTSFATTGGRVIRRGTTVADDDPLLAVAPNYFAPAAGTTAGGTDEPAGPAPTGTSRPKRRKAG